MEKGDETGDDLAIVVEMDDDGDGAFDEGDWNMSPKLNSLLVLMREGLDGACIWLLTFILLNDVELLMKLNDENDEDDNEATVFAVAELDWLVLLSSLSVRLLKLKLKAFKLESSKLYLLINLI